MFDTFYQIRRSFFTEFRSCDARGAAVDHRGDLRLKV